MSDASGPIVVLAGGTGGAKLARAMRDVAGEDLVVIANTGDDIELHGAYVSPDPDLICFWLADRIDSRGWGLAGDTFEYMKTIDHWFNLGDQDRAIGIRRREIIERGETLTTAIGELAGQLGIAARVLPMSDDPVRTQIKVDGGWIAFQEFMVREQAAPEVEDVRFAGAQAATATEAVREAIAEARAIIVGPSNPVISIGPILAVAEDELRAAAAPVIALSPIVGGKVLKGPTAEFLRWAGHDATSAGVQEFYGDVIDVLVTDDTPLTAANRERRARELLELALAWR